MSIAKIKYTFNGEEKEAQLESKVGFPFNGEAEVEGTNYLVVFELCHTNIPSGVTDVFDKDSSEPLDMSQFEIQVKEVTYIYTE